MHEPIRGDFKPEERNHRSASHISRWTRDSGSEGVAYPAPLKAVILAAGRGSRLRHKNKGTPKPLTRVLVFSLIERAIHCCREVGVRDFVIVVGYKKEIIISYLEKLQKKIDSERVAHPTPLTIQIVENQNWELGNGTSALASKPYVSGPFLLLMADHVFNRIILRKLIGADDNSGCCWLAVDRKIDKIANIEEATKVQIDDNKVKKIGKRISKFDGVDTGLFLCYPILFDALKTAQEEGDFSLTGGIQKLIKWKKMDWVDVSGLFWQDVDTPMGLKYARKKLLGSLRKPEEDGWVSYYLNRPISIRLSAWLARQKVSPNFITWISFLLSLIGALSFSLGKYSYAVIAGILIQLSSIIDGCDGEVARLQFKKTAFGGWLDTILDRYGEIAIAVGITYGFWKMHSGVFSWIWCIIAISGFILASYTKKEFYIRYRRSITENWLTKLIRRDLRLFLIFLGALLNQGFEALMITGLLSHFGTVSLLVTRKKSAS